jgi:hypothetical protein
MFACTTIDYTQMQKKHCLFVGKDRKVALCKKFVDIKNAEFEAMYALYVLNLKQINTYAGKSLWDDELCPIEPVYLQN